MTPLQTPEVRSRMGATDRRSLSTEQIREMLPHSWPFLFVDRVVDLVPGQSGTGIKNVTITEPVFAGHFPSESIFPGVLLVEAAAQTSGVILASGFRTGDLITDEDGRRIVDLTDRDPAPAEVPTRMLLACIKRMKFREPARPGDQLRIRASVTGSSAMLYEFRIEVRADARVICDGSIIVGA